MVYHSPNRPQVMPQEQQMQQRQPVASEVRPEEEPRAESQATADSDSAVTPSGNVIAEAREALIESNLADSVQEEVITANDGEDGHGQSSNDCDTNENVGATEESLSELRDELQEHSDDLRHQQSQLREISATLRNINTEDMAEE